MTIASPHVRARRTSHPWGDGFCAVDGREKIGSAGRLQITRAEPCGTGRKEEREEGRKEGWVRFEVKGPAAKRRLSKG